MNVTGELYDDVEILDAFKLYFLISELQARVEQVQKIISNQALSSPYALAVKHGEVELSYKELEEKSNAIANYLVAKGVTVEATVGVFLEESVLLPVCILGILKAGGTYVPIAADYPAARIEAIINDAGITNVFTDKGKSSLFQTTTVKIHELDTTLSIIENPIAAAPDVEIADAHAAYIIYTSGSTGIPKGVVVEHGSLAHYLNWYLEDLQSITNVNLPLTSSICFAAAITQMFSPLMMGKTLYIINRSIVKQPELLLQWYSEHPGYGLYCVPTLWEGIVNYIEEGNVPIGKPDCIYLSGESLSKTLVNRTFDIWPEMQFWNLYGPTEATANISIYKVERGKEVYLGTSIRGGSILLLDENMNHVPDGEEGFVYISSRALARGYLNRPELNRTNFITDHNIPGFEGVTLYNTGDIGKYNEKKELLYLGRRDQQVKIRGYRIELSEIEKVLNNYKEIRQAACKVITDDAGNKKIAAFIVCRDSAVAVNKIREYLASSLPEYMIPEVFTFLSEMPKLANSKIDRSKLIIDNNQRPELTYDNVAAVTEQEKQLLAIWEEALDVKGLGMNDDFFDLGGNSLKMVKLLNLIQTKFNKTVSFDDVWKKSTPSEILEVITTKALEAKHTHQLTTAPVQKNTVPLSFSQTGLWFIAQSRPEQTAYNMLFTLTMQGNVSVDLVKGALNLLLQRHDMLRSNFKVENRNPVRIINEQPVVNVNYSEAVGKSKQEIAAFGSDLSNKLFAKQLNLSEDSLINFHLVKYGAEGYKLFVQVHHIIFDGVSINIFASDFLACYNSLVDESVATQQLSAIEFTYSDYDQWLKKNYFNGELDSVYAFWKTKLKDANYFLNFPTDSVRPKMQSYKGKNKKLIIDAEKFERLKTFNRTKKTTPFVTLLSVFKLLVHRYTNESDILIGVPFANRTQRGMQSLIGYFVNTLVYRTRFENSMTFDDLLKHIRNYTSDALIHQHYPFEKLVEKLNPERSVSYNPVYQILFAYHDKLVSGQTSTGISIVTEELANPQCKFDMDVEAQEQENTISINFNYNVDLFDDSTIDGFITHFSYLLEQVLTKPDAQLSDYLLESNATLQKKLAVWNNTAAPIPEGLIHEFFEKQVVDHPDKIAVQSAEGSLTYKELNEKANQLAGLLREKNIKAESIVGILIDRSLEMMIGLLGILKSGAAYLPIGTDYPQERVKYVLSDSGATVLLTKQKFSTGIEFSGEILCIDNADIYAEKQSANLPYISTPKNLAYVIYTSGSTGNPKGVMIEHRSVINRIHWMYKNYPLNTTDIVLQKTAYTFDVSVWELFGWAFNGCSLYLLEYEGEKNPETLVNTVYENKISTIHFVPSMFNVFLEYVKDNKIAADKFRSLKYVFASGEALEKYQVERFDELIASGNDVKLLNLYGPTEATIEVSYFDCDKTENYKKVPIGKPVDNIQLYVLDRLGQPLPEKIPGELCIAGMGLARGYFNNPLLTSEKFIDATFNGQRMYKTGDLVRWLPDGNIEYMGRIDQQVKIRGFRIELGEIENCMSRHNNVESAAAIVKKFGHDDTRIVAYYVLKDKTQQVDFKAYLRAFLPDYMLPSVFIAIDTIPFLSSGKLNVQALPEPVNTTKRVIGEREYNNDYEKRLASIWNQVLKTDEFDTNDNFYDVGGHSLLLIKMKYMVDSEFGINVSVVDLFQYPTIKMLAEVIASANVNKTKSDIANRAAAQRQARINNTKKR